MYFFKLIYWKCIFYGVQLVIGTWTAITERGWDEVREDVNQNFGNAPPRWHCQGRFNKTPGSCKINWVLHGSEFWWEERDKSLSVECRYPGSNTDISVHGLGWDLRGQDNCEKTVLTSSDKILKWMYCFLLWRMRGGGYSLNPCMLLRASWNTALLQLLWNKFCL